MISIAEYTNKNGQLIEIKYKPYCGYCIFVDSVRTQDSLDSDEAIMWLCNANHCEQKSRIGESE